MRWGGRRRCTGKCAAVPGPGAGLTHRAPLRLAPWAPRRLPAALRHAARGGSAAEGGKVCGHGERQGRAAGLTTLG